MAQSESGSTSRTGRRSLENPLWLVGFWIALQLLFYNRLIFHDSWIHNFPMIFHVAGNDTCGALPSWLAGVDGGYPLIIEAISTTITQITRLLALLVMGCLDLDVVPALFVQKAQIYLAYLIFAAGMYFLGRLLYRNRLSATFLLGATLFAGLCLQNAHSDQTVNILFWVPWIVSASVLYLRSPDRESGSLYVNVAALLFSLQMLDQYPHFAVLAAAAGLIILALLRSDAFLGWTPRLLLRLWPAVLFALAAAIQLLIVKDSIGAFRPSLRADIVVDPRMFGETGFAQPTALIGTFFPLGFMAGFDTFAAGLRAWISSHGGQPGSSWFMYRLDSFFFYIGIIPLIAFVASLLRNGEARARLGWGIFALLMFLVSLQQSGLYFLLFKLPFFDVFRSYGLYLCFCIFAVLVMCGYGFDALHGAQGDHGKSLLKRSLKWTVIAAALAAVFLAWIIGLTSAPLNLMRKVASFLLLDMLLIAGAAWTIGRYCLVQATGKIGGPLIVAMVVSQSLYFAFAYGGIGISTAKALERMGVSAATTPGTALNAPAGSDSPARTICTVFAQCYLARNPVISLNTDLQGTFLRSREMALYQPGLEKPVIFALSAITHPVFWISHGVQPYDSKDEAIARLNARKDRIGEFLRETTQVSRADLSGISLPSSPGSTEAVIRHRETSRDRMILSYHSDQPAYLNAAVTFDPHWRASIDGASVPVIRGNFDGLLLPLPAGTRTVTLEYRNIASDLFFYSRYAMLFLACLAIAWLVRIVRLREQ